MDFFFGMVACFHGLMVMSVAGHFCLLGFCGGGRGSERERERVGDGDGDGGGGRW